VLNAFKFLLLDVFWFCFLFSLFHKLLLFSLLLLFLFFLLLLLPLFIYLQVHLHKVVNGVDFVIGGVDVTFIILGNDVKIQI